MSDFKPIGMPHPGQFYKAIQDESIECRAIMACDMDGVLGHKGDLIFHNKEDMDFFREKTMGCAVVMGRKTFESMGRKGLKGRVNIVMSKLPGDLKAQWLKDEMDKQSPGPVYFCSSTTQVLSVLQETGMKKLWVIGGGKIYSLFAAYCRTIVVTYYRTHVFEDGVRMGLLPKGFKKTDCARFIHLGPVRRHSGTIVANGHLNLTNSDSETFNIPYNITAYTMHVSSVQTKARKALEAETKSDYEAGFTFAGGKRYRYDNCRDK